MYVSCQPPPAGCPAVNLMSTTKKKNMAAHVSVLIQQQDGYYLQNIVRFWLGCFRQMNAIFPALYIIF